MSVVSFASAKGSPGVTTTVTSLAALWPGEVTVAELDPVGGDLGLRLQISDAEPLDEGRGLVSFGAAIRRGGDVDINDHLQRTDDDLDVLAGVSTPGQGRGLATAWPHIAKGLRTSSVDVLADCGRFVPGSPVVPVIEQSSALILVARNEVEGIAHLRTRLTALQEATRMGGMETVRIGYLLVGDPGDTRGVDDVVRLLSSAGLKAEPMGVVAHDPKTIAALRTGSSRRLSRSLYVRSLHEVGQQIRRFARIETPVVEPS